MMNGYRVAPWAAVLCGLVYSIPAQAQFSSIAVTSQGTDSTAKPKHIGVTLYPVSPFVVNGPGNFSTTLVGTLIAADYSAATRRGSYQLGAWAWVRDGADIFEVHGKYFFTPNWGAHIGILGSTNGGGNPIDAYLLYHFNLGKSGPQRGIRFEAALGIFEDPAVVSTTSFSGYLQAETSIARNLNLSMSYWYLQDKGLDGHRFGIGIGTRF